MDNINQNPFTTLVLSKRGLQHILSQVRGLEQDDRRELVDALQVCEDKITLEQNAVTTPLSLYK